LVALGVATASLPWATGMNGFLLITLTTLCMLLLLKGSDLKDRDGRILVMLSAFYFLLHVISLLYTENMKEGIFHLDKKWSFALVPFSVWLVCMRFPEARKKVFMSFCASLFGATVVCLGIAVKNNLAENHHFNYPVFFFNKWFYSYKLLSFNIGIHPSYLSCYLGVVIIFLIWESFRQEKTNRLYIFLIIYFVTFMTMLAARTVLFSTLGACFLIAVYGIIRFRKYNYVWAIAAAFILIGVVLFLNDISRQRMTAIFQSVHASDGQWGTFGVRLLEWKATFAVIAQHPWIGVAPGDFMDTLVAEYTRNGWLEPAGQRYNSHNQFLQSFGSFGITGFLCIAAIFLLSFRRAIVNRDVVYFFMLGIFFIFSLTESTLEVQKGIVFFNLMNSVLFFSEKTLNSQKNLYD